MEFFATAAARLSAHDIQRLIRIDRLPEYCASISQVLGCDGDKGDIYCVWGEFRIHREVIREGLRFTLPTCPNALQWTVTASGQGAQAHVLIHATINRDRHAPEFIESLEQFVADWKAGLEASSQRNGACLAPGECMPWFG